MKDEEIMELFWNRDEAAIAATADAYGSYCYTIAYNILHCNEDAEECVNNTYWKAWKSIPPHRPNRLATYLGKITRNLALDRVKLLTAQKRGLGQTELALSELEDCVSAEASAEQALDELVLADAIEKFLYGLPKAERNLFIGRYWYLYPIRDLAAAYKMREGNVASMLYRLRKKLKLHLEKEGIPL